MPLNADDFKRLVEILETWSGWKLERDRLDFMEEVLRPSSRARDILGQFDPGGNSHNSAVRTVSRLDQFGEDIPGREVTCLLIAALRPKVGLSEQADLDAIAGRLKCPKTTVKPNKGERVMLPPESIAAGVAFLFEVGRWAKSELSEIWKLRRKEKEIELSKQETASDKTNLTAFLEEAAADFGAENVERVLRLVQNKHSLILAQIARIDTAREQRRMGELTADMLNAQIEDADKQKKQLLKEIKDLLDGMGLT